jgi:hypothetical protein
MSVLLDRASTHLIPVIEKRVIEQFGEAYRDYQRWVPMFIPRRSQWRELIARSNAKDESKDDLPLGG